MISDIEFLRTIMGQQGGVQDLAAFQKNLTAATGFVGYNLENEAKLMLPAFAGWRNRVAVDTPKTGAKEATWRMMLGYGGFAFGAAANFGTANGGNGGATTPAAVSISAAYKSQSVKGDVEWEAIQQSRGWDDAMAIETSIALATVLKYDELLNIGGNMTLLTPPVILGNPSTLSAANTFAAGNWHVKVTAVTLQGALTNAAANSNVGETAISNNLQIVVPGGDCDFLDVYWAPVEGAVGYKVYCEDTVASGTWHLSDPATDLCYRKVTAGATDLTAYGDRIVVPTGQTYVGVNHVQIIALPGVIPANVPPAGDASVNNNSFEGLFSWCTKNTIYTQALPENHPVIDMDGAPLTTSGTGIYEIDQYLLNLWQTKQISPNLILTSSNGVNSMTNKLVAANSGSMFRLDVTQERNKIVGGLFLGGYNNKFATSMMGVPSAIDVWAHPYIPDGTFLFVTENMPPSYKYSRTGKVFALDVQTPYTYWELGRTARSIPFDVFFGETLKCYYPTAQGAICGARVDA
jgi:hypothetical protein